MNHFFAMMSWRAGLNFSIKVGSNAALLICLRGLCRLMRDSFCTWEVAD